MNVDDEERLDGEEDHEANFQFFLELAKPLVLELPSSEDRAMAAAWVKRLEAEPETDEEKRLRVDYLKLLLFVMQRGRLIGMFKKEPSQKGLQQFPQGFGLAEMGNLLLEEAELQENGDPSETGVPYSVEISNDLKEFVAAQEIPDFGVQVYYAWSMEHPIHKWPSFDENKFPQYVRDKIRQIKVVNSEEKTQAQPSQLGDDTRRKCESAIYERTKAKVKSPQEIERSLERKCYFLGNSSMQGFLKDENKAWSSGKKSRIKRATQDGCPQKTETEARYSNQGFQESDECDSDFRDGVRNRGTGGYKSDQYYRTRKSETSKRLQFK